MIKINLFCERWKVIPHSANYGISNQGRVMRLGKGQGTQAGRILKPFKDLNGYLCVNLWKNGNCKFHRIASLVALCFLGPCPIGKQINHKNGIKAENKNENLEYVTPSQNAQHAYDLGLRTASPLYGDLNPAAKLKEQDIFSIIRLRKRGLSQQQIAIQFNVVHQTISKILLGKLWSSVTGITQSRFPD